MVDQGLVELLGSVIGVVIALAIVFGIASALG